MHYALDAIRRRPLRSLATSLGIGLATALVVLLLALSSGIQSSSGRLAASSGIDLIATSENTSLSAGTFPEVAGAHSLPAGFRSADSNIASASPWLVGSLLFANGSLRSATLSAPNGSGVPGGWGPTSAGTVGWIPSENAGLNTPALVAGPGWSTADDRHYANGTYTGPTSGETEIDQGLAAVLHVGVGDRIWISPRSIASPNELDGWFADSTALTVVGVTQPFWLFPSALLGFMYLSELQSLASHPPGEPDVASIVLVHLSDPTDPARDQARLSSAYPALSVFTIGNILAALQSSVDLYRTFGTIVGAIGVIAATLFTTTILLMSVDDRSREIALLRAVGFTRGRIGSYILGEGLLLALGGLAVGLVLGAVAANLLNAFLSARLGGLPAGFSFVSFDTGVVLAGLAEVMAIGVIASMAPTVRAVTLPVVEELRAP